MRKFLRLAPLALLIVPNVTFAAAPTTFDELAKMVVQLLDNATATLVVAGIVVYFFGISSNMIKVGKGETSEMRSYLVWGIGVIFVMVSIWGILQILQNTLFGQGGASSIGGSSSGAPCSSFSGCNFGSP